MNYKLAPFVPSVTTQGNMYSWEGSALFFGQGDSDRIRQRCHAVHYKLSSSGIPQVCKTRITVVGHTGDRNCGKC